MTARKHVLEWCPYQVFMCDEDEDTTYLRATFYLRSDAERFAAQERARLWNVSVVVVEEEVEDERD